MKYYWYIFLVAVVILDQSCTKTITVDLPTPEDQLVIEGTIEPGEPPLILLTQNSAYFGGLDLNSIRDYFVNGAQMAVWSSRDTNKIALIELCTDALTEDQKAILAAELGFEINDSTEIPDICIYTVPDIVTYFLTGNSILLGQPNTTYFLEVRHEGDVLTARTYMPGLIPVSLSFRDHPDEDNDTLVRLYAEFDEPDTSGNFLRHFTKRNDESFYAPEGNSVFDDNLFSAATFDVPINRGEGSDPDFAADEYGYFWRGDTVIIKWSSIDKGSYDFWNTFENDFGDSPFSAPLPIQTNITGGLGVWCAYGSAYDTLIIPE